MYEVSSYMAQGAPKLQFYLLETKLFSCDRIVPTMATKMSITNRRRQSCNDYEKYSSQHCFQWSLSKFTKRGFPM